MRYCKRTFFNKLLQPHRIGKAILMHAPFLFRKRLFEARQSRAHRLYVRTSMQEFRRGKTPKNLILGRYQKVRTYNLYNRLGLRTSPSIFVRRARTYVPKILDIQ